MRQIFFQTKLLCDKRDRAITCLLCRDLHLTLKFSGLCKKICLKERFGGKIFQTKLFSRLSHKVCCFLSSPVLLCKFTYRQRIKISAHYQQELTCPLYIRNECYSFYIL